MFLYIGFIQSLSNIHLEHKLYEKIFLKCFSHIYLFHIYIITVYNYKCYNFLFTYAQIVKSSILNKYLNNSNKAIR